MTDIEQREPVAWFDQEELDWIKGHKDDEEIDACSITAAIRPIGKMQTPLYTGQQLAEVEARAQRREQTIVDAWNAFGPTIAHSIHDVEDLDVVCDGTLAEQIAELSTQRDTAEAEAERLRALVEEAKRVLEPFAVVDPMDVYESEDEDANGRYVLTQANFRAARDLRDRLGVEG